MQVDVGDGTGETAQFFVRLWASAMHHWLQGAGPGDVLPFASELGPPRYAITTARRHEFSDRWEQSLVMKRLAEQAWAKRIAATWNKRAGAMTIASVQLGPMGNNTYLIVDEATRDAALVDPSFDSEELWPEIQKLGVTLRFLLNTHAHFDHVIGNAFYSAKTGVPIALHRADLPLLRALPEQGRMFGFDVDASPDPTIWLEDGKPLTLGGTRIAVLHTPGHSPGGVTFLVGDAAIVGDCLFAGSIGRTDLPGASLQTLLHSIQTRLLTLPDSTRVLPGHERVRRSEPNVVPIHSFGTYDFRGARICLRTTTGRSRSGRSPATRCATAARSCSSAKAGFVRMAAFHDQRLRVLPAADLRAPEI